MADNFVNNPQTNFKKLQITNPKYGFLLNSFIAFYSWLIQIPKLNRVYEKIVLSMNKELNFWQASIKVLDIKIKISDQDLLKIPKSGATLIVANHPFGGVEALVTGDILSKVRQDFLFVANKTLNMLPELKPYLISVSVDEEKVTSAKIKNHTQIQKAVQHLKSGGAVVIFPSGEIATARPPWSAAKEKKWNSTVSRLAKKSEAKVVPFYYGGKNSLLFQLVSFLMLPPKGLISKTLRKVGLFLRLSLMIREVLGKYSTTVQLKIGSPILFEKYSHVKSHQALAEYFRIRTYLLAGESQWLKTRLDFLNRESRFKPLSDRRMQPIGNPIPSAILKNEIESLKQTIPEACVYKIFNYGIYIAKKEHIPNIVLEIARLREITFRAEGEGSGLSYDIDSFDEDYEHLFIWEENAYEVIGAYRLGSIDELINKKGISGVYTHQLFKYDPKFLKQIGNAIELGRSFIIEKYQKTRALSFLLTGLAYVLYKRPHIQTLFGPASISAEYSPLSSFIMIEYLMRHHGADNSLRDQVKPPYPFKLQSNINEKNLDNLINGTHDLTELNAVIESVEDNEKSVPTLITYYSKIGAKYVTFNVDPEFSSIDGLIVVNLSEFPLNSLKKMIGEESARNFLASRQSSHLQQNHF